MPAYVFAYIFPAQPAWGIAVARMKPQESEADTYSDKKTPQQGGIQFIPALYAGGGQAHRSISSRKKDSKYLP